MYSHFDLDKKTIKDNVHTHKVKKEGGNGAVLNVSSLFLHRTY